MDSPEATGSPFQFIEGRLLSEVELQALVESEDKGIQPAPMKQYGSLEEFQQGQNNFYMTFAALPGRVAHEIYRGKLAFQRFQALHPELCETIDTKLHGVSVENLDLGQWELLYEGYKELSRLVDVNDPHVLRDGEVDTWSLCR